jgi:hypothetical protein
MAEPLDTIHVPNTESGDIFAFSNSSQPLIYTSPLPPSQCFVVHTPINAYPRANYASPAIPVTNSGALLRLVPCPRHLQHQACSYQFEYQHIGLDLVFPYDLSELQILDDNMSMATAVSQVTRPNELQTMANDDIPPSKLVFPTIIGSQMQSPTTSLAEHYYPSHPLSPEAYQGLQALPCHQSQRPACPELNCGKTFKRAYELKRHVDTVHGRKENCPYNACRYKTGRKDKMEEHARKVHGKARDWDVGGNYPERKLDL